MTCIDRRPLLRFLPWLLASAAAHALLLVQWPPAGTPVAVAGNAARGTPVQVQLLRRAEPARDAIEAPVLATVAIPDVETTVAAKPIAAARPVTPTARSAVSPLRPQAVPTQQVATAASTLADAATPAATPGASTAPAIAGDSEAARDSADVGWAELMTLLHAAIDRHKRYPQSALRMGREGSARVDFRLQPDGRIDDLNIGVSSGERALDLAAYRAVRAIAPFTGADRYLDRAQRFQVDVVFRIN